MSILKFDVQSFSGNWIKGQGIYSSNEEIPAAAVPFSTFSLPEDAMNMSKSSNVLITLFSIFLNL